MFFLTQNCKYMYIQLTMQTIVKYKCDEIQLKTTNNKNLTYTVIT